MIEILIKNKFNRLIQILRKFKLDFMQKINYKHCF